VRLAAHQPQYLPWLGYFDKIDRVDQFVLLDTVQYKKNEWQNRNRIRTAQGWQWLTVPVHHRHPMRISEVRVDDTTPWRRKHKEALRQAYGRAPHAGPVLAALGDLIDRPTDSLAELNTASVRCLAALFGLRTPIVLASSLEGIPEGPDARLIELCRRFRCSTYVAGAGGQAYMDPEAWQKAGIEVEFQDFRHPVYSQGHPGFEPRLSAIDLLMRFGGDAAGILRGTARVAA